MAHILITAGPTRAYLDDVRYLTNASSGRMAAALARAAVADGHQVSLSFYLYLMLPLNREIISTKLFHTVLSIDAVFFLVLLVAANHLSFITCFGTAMRSLMKRY